jgi:hypothetical protein
MRRRWRQTKDGFVEIVVSQNAPTAPSIRMDVQPFRSPIDGTMINTRVDLENHNRRHGVTNDLDSLRENTKRHLERGRAAPASAKKERINALIEAYDRTQSSSHQRQVRYEDDPLN